MPVIIRKSQGRNPTRRPRVETRMTLLVGERVDLRTDKAVMTTTRGATAATNSKGRGELWSLGDGRLFTSHTAFSTPLTKIATRRETRTPARMSPPLGRTNEAQRRTRPTTTTARSTSTPGAPKTAAPTIMKRAKRLNNQTLARCFPLGVCPPPCELVGASVLGGIPSMNHRSSGCRLPTIEPLCLEMASPGPSPAAGAGRSDETRQGRAQGGITRSTAPRSGPGVGTVSPSTPQHQALE